MTVLEFFGDLMGHSFTVENFIGIGWKRLFDQFDATLAE